MIKKSSFSDIEILEIHQKIIIQQGTYTVTDISNINKQKQPNWNEPPTLKNENTTQPNNAQGNKPLTQEQNTNIRTKGKSRKFKKNY